MKRTISALVAAVLAAATVLASAPFAALAAGNLNPNEQAILTLLQTKPTTKAGATLGLPARYLERAREYMERPDVDIDAETAAQTMQVIREGIRIVEASSATTLRELATAEDFDKLVAVAKEAARINGLELDSNLLYSLMMNEQKITKITLSVKKKTLKRGKTFQATATVAPTNALRPTLKWTTSNKAVATVSKTGLIKATGYGVAVITASAQDGSGKKARLTVRVRPKQVTGVQVRKASAKRLVLQFRKTAGAEKYQVYMKRGIGSYKRYKMMCTTRKTRFVTRKLKRGKVYRFKVRAVKTTDGKTVRGAFSKKTKKIKI